MSVCFFQNNNSYITGSGPCLIVSFVAVLWVARQCVAPRGAPKEWLQSGPDV